MQKELVYTFLQYSILCSVIQWWFWSWAPLLKLSFGKPILPFMTSTKNRPKKSQCSIKKTFKIKKRKRNSHKFVKSLKKMASFCLTLLSKDNFWKINWTLKSSRGSSFCTKKRCQVERFQTKKDPESLNKSCWIRKNILWMNFPKTRVPWKKMKQWNEFTKKSSVRTWKKTSYRSLRKRTSKKKCKNWWKKSFCTQKLSTHKLLCTRKCFWSYSSKKWWNHLTKSKKKASISIEIQ